MQRKLEAMVALPVGLLFAYFAYQWAVEVAATYADLLEVTFDLYRFSLYRTLQWPLPANQDEEKHLAVQFNTYLARGYTAQGFQYTLPDQKL